MTICCHIIVQVKNLKITLKHFKLSHQTFKCVFLNFLTPLFNVKGVFNNGQSSQTVGSLDMGGASAQKVNSCHQKQEGHLFITSISNSLQLLG